MHAVGHPKPSPLVGQGDLAREAAAGIRRWSDTARQGHVRTRR